MKTVEMMLERKTEEKEKNTRKLCSKSCRMNRHGNQARPSHKIKFDAIFVEKVAQQRQHDTTKSEWLISIC